MHIVELSQIEVRRRQRSSIKPGPLNELRDSIVTSGLLHPPVCWWDARTKTWVLVAGERRLAAITLLAEAQTRFHYGSDAIAPGLVPITPVGDYLDEAGVFEAELDENIHRVDIEWQDRTRALSALHTMRKTENPRQTLQDTGAELAAKQGTTSVRAASQRVRDAEVIAQHLDNEKISGARNATEALALIYKSEEEKVRAALVRRQLALLPDKPQLEVRNGDLLEILPKLPAGTYDLVLADPPYGISASRGGFRQRTVLHHNYEDTPEVAQAIALAILTEGFRITKPRANLFLFHDIRTLEWLMRTAQNMGWSPFPRPLIWQKSESEGLAPWGAQGPRITTEYIFYATKGQRGLNASPTDVLNVRRVPRHERIHAAEKPVELLRKLIECSTLPGDAVIDPCCGSGSTLVACRESRRIGLGIEKDPDYYNTALSNLHNDDQASGMANACEQDEGA